jgi:hypothetical protein
MLVRLSDELKARAIERSSNKTTSGDAEIRLSARLDARRNPFQSENSPTQGIMVSPFEWQENKHSLVEIVSR